MSRAAGLLLHVSSLAGEAGVGDFEAARRLGPFLAGAGLAFWQVLPLAPGSPAAGNSPYSTLAGQALDPVFVDLARLEAGGLLEPGEVPPAAPQAGGASWEAERERKAGALRLAVGRLDPGGAEGAALGAFRRQSASWLEDWALFSVLRARHAGRPWSEWPEELRDRRPEALGAIRRELAEELEAAVRSQFLLHRQWRELRRALAAEGVRILGDLPFYLPLDSADVWSHRELFRLDSDGRPLALAGVPPDAYSDRGQLWGHPVYAWEAHQAEGWRWWLDRFAGALSLYDRVRIDHFRGLEATWQTPAGAPDASQGSWVESPGASLLEAATRRWPGMPFVAEDLGMITEAVWELVERFALPSTRVLQFGFGEEYPESEHLPEKAPARCAFYTGTHDLDTLRGWLTEGLDDEQRGRVADWLGTQPTPESAPEMVRRAFASPADLVVLPAQDLLGLGSEARMNRPGEGGGQWRWRLAGGELDGALAAEARELVAGSDRLTRPGL